jgi:glycosyltransferase involved in cell wall biosynthesis
MHNEEGNVEPLYEGIRETMEKLGQPYEIIFINDASTDQTLSIMKRVASEDPHFRYIDLESNVGENWALLAGVSKAAGEVIITIDGDYQNDPSYIPSLLKELSKGYRVVSGWRKNRIGSLWARRLPSQVANAFICMITGVRVHDCGCGLKAYRREVLEGKFVPKGFMNRFSPVVFGVKRQEFSEVAIVDRSRRSGQSHYGMGRVFVVFRDLLTLPFTVRESQKWLWRFFWIQWVCLFTFIVLALCGWWTLAVAVCLLALVSFSNAKNLKRFVDAQANPQFRIRELR